MRAALRLIPCLGLAALVLWHHEQGAHTWTPMFRLILAALALSTVLAWGLFHRALKATTRRQWYMRHVLAVFVFFASWIIFWAAAEEGLIAWSLAQYGPDDSGGRYFYPGHSGMGYANGFSFPFSLAWQIATLALPSACLFGMLLALIGGNDLACRGSELDARP